MISSENWGARDDLSRHYGILLRNSGQLRATEFVKVYRRSRKRELITVELKQAGELKLAAGSPAANKACSDCRTTSTPLWRKGPTGRQTLCNACGIRYKRGLLGIKGTKAASFPSAAGRVSYEELKQKQKEKQMKMLALSTRTNIIVSNNNKESSNKEMKGERKKKKRSPMRTKMVVAAADSGRTEAEEAARLLLSLSAGVPVH